MAEKNFKTCRYCADQINVAAKVCPRCRQWLTIVSLRNPGALIVATGLTGLAFVIGFSIFIHSMVNHGIDFAPYRSQISIIDSRMDLGTNTFDKSPIVYVVAVVTNQTDMAWQYIHLEARFYDKSGTLIDVGDGAYNWSLSPKTDGVVLIRAKTLHPFADYASYKIYVGNALDAHARF
jgi:hypothetical protein